MKCSCRNLSSLHYFVLTLICSEFFKLSLCVNLRKLFKPENEELLTAMREELDQFKIDMTRSFMLKHSRRKRALDGHVNDIEVKTDGRFQEVLVDAVGPFSTFSFAGKPYVIKRNGIYELTGLEEMAAGRTVESTNLLIKRGTWKLKQNEIVLNGLEWKHNYFIVTTTGKFSTIYTLHEKSLQPIFRQNIQNKANAIAAEFFDYRWNLYMVLLNDNDMHATTFSPVFRWADTYMDEIHQVQTTGAQAVKTFAINSKAYIAIAQSQDSTGNTQIGTMVLSMDHVDRLERVQLLWSNGAQNLQYMHTDKEHFLVIGQKNEPSIVYWFGGMDFIFWQQFDNLQGEGLLLESFQLTSDEPLLLTSDGGSQLNIFSRSVSPTKIMTTWVTSKTLEMFSLETVSANTKISTMKILRIGESMDSVFLAVSRNLPGSSQKETLRVYPVNLVKRQLAVSQTKPTGDSLSQCLDNLKTSLSNSEPNLERISEISKMVLTVDEDWQFNGELASVKLVKPVDSQVESAEIRPALARGSTDRVETAPSKLLENIKQSNVKLEDMKSELENIFYKSQRPNVVTGNLKFLDNVEFNNVEAMENTNLAFATINDKSWEMLDTFALRKSSEEGQEASVAWTVESLKTDTYETVSEASKLVASNFMLKSCSSPQSVFGVQKFTKEVKVQSVNVEPETTINGIQFSDIVQKDNINRDILGFKHVPEVKGDYSTEFVSGKKLQEWFAGIARISGNEDQRFTGPVEVEKDADIQIDNLFVELLNDKSWDEFRTTVMLDGVDQEVKGLFNVEALKTDNLVANFISGISSDGILTSGRNQHISSHFTAETVQIAAPLSTGIINGIELSDAVNQNDGTVEINGPVVLENFKVKDVLVSEGVLIADKDVSELASLQKVHEYTTTDNSPLFLSSLQTDSLTTPQIDNENVDEFSTNYWSRSGNNVANPAQLVLDTRKVSVTQGDFQTGNLNHFNFPDDFVSLDQKTIMLKAPLQFKKAVTAMSDVTMSEGAKIEDIDMSEAHGRIVDENFVGTISGVKTFAFPIRAVHGAHIKMLNGRDPLNDVVMRNSQEVQQIDGVLKFTKEVTTDHFTVKNGHVNVDGLVNQVNLAEIREKTAYLDKSNAIKGELVFERDVNAKTFATAQMNEMNIDEITNNMVFLDHPGMQTILGHVVLDNGKTDFFSDSTVGTINNVPLSGYLPQVVFMNSPDELLIGGTKTFKDASMNDGLMCGTFNDVDLKDLETNAFSKSKSQAIAGNWKLRSAQFNGNLESSTIEGIALENMAFTDEPADISSPVSFTAKQTSIQGPISVTGHVNGIKFDESMKDGIAINGPQNFDEVIVGGNLDWANDRPELQRLSYLFQEAVTKSGPQQLSGQVTFRNGFHSLKVDSPEKWLGNVDLQKIQEDAVTKNAPNVVLSGQNQFDQTLKIQNLVNPVTNLDTEQVNNINLKSMSEDIVQTDSLENGPMITGRKQLLSKLQVDNLRVEDKLADIAVSDLVLVNNPSKIGKVQFRDVEVEEDIEPEETKGLDLNTLLNDRVSLTKPNQNLQGSFSVDQATVENAEGCRVPVINDIIVQNVIRKSNVKDLQTISGKKTFKNLAIQGQMSTSSLNNHPIQNLVSSTMRVDRGEKITRPVIFEAPVVVNRGLKVESINDVHLEEFSTRVSERISRLVSDAKSPEPIANELSIQASKLQQLAQERPFWLEYLRMNKDLTGLGLGAQSRVDHVQVTKSGEILVILHSNTDGQAKGLPQGCQCNSVFTVNLKDFVGTNADASTPLIGQDDCLNIYNVRSPNKRSYTVMSDAMSSNTSCVTHIEQEETTSILMDKKEISNTKMGHISDVGVFSEEESDFLVLAQYFDKNTKSHSTITRVMRVDATGNIENVQNIETHGARKVALSKVNDKWMLAIANSKSSTDESSCNADSAIYVWSSESNQFLLLRTIMTDGAFDVEFITTETSNEFYKQSSVAFAQEGNSASGEVLIFRYEQPGGNFVMSQTLRSNWPVMGVRTMCMCRQCFLVTTVPQEGITFYENRFVEGFQEYYKAPVFGAKDISGFQLKDKYLFAIATDKGPILAEAVVAGSCSNN